MFELAWHIEL